MTLVQKLGLEKLQKKRAQFLTFSTIEKYWKHFERKARKRTFL